MIFYDDGFISRKSEDDSMHRISQVQLTGEGKGGGIKPTVIF